MYEFFTNMYSNDAPIVRVCLSRFRVRLSVMLAVLFITALLKENSSVPNDMYCDPSLKISTNGKMSSDGRLLLSEIML